MPPSRKNWCIGFLPILAALVAWTNHAVFSYFCDTIQYGDGALELGVWYFKESEVGEVNLGPGGIFVDPQYAERDTCTWIPNDLDKDASWKFTRAMTIIIGFLGGIWIVAMVFSKIVNCLRMSINKISYFMSGFLAILQALCFLFLNSNACSLPVDELLNVVSDTTLSFDEDCEWNTGMRTNVVAVVFWALSGVLVYVTDTYCKPAPMGRHEEEQIVTYEKTVNPDGTAVVTKTGVVIKGTSVPEPEEPSKA